MPGVRLKVSEWTVVLVGGLLGLFLLTCTYVAVGILFQFDFLSVRCGH